MSIRVLEALEKGKIQCKAISLYPSCLHSVLYSSVERNESPTLLVKRVWNDRLEDFEIEIVFLGDYHMEKPTYLKKPRREWISFGNFVLTPSQAEELGKLLIDLSSKGYSDD